MAELEMLMSRLKPDVVVITETTPKSCSTMTTTPAKFHAFIIKCTTPSYISHICWNIPGNSIFTNLESDTQRNIRGVAGDTKTSLSIREVEMETFLRIPLLLCVSLHDQEKLLVGCVYRSPSSGTQNNEALNKLPRMIVNRQESHIIIVGDFNFLGIDWEVWYIGVTPQHPAHQFIETLLDIYFHQHVTETTRHRQGQELSILCLVITNVNEMIKSRWNTEPHLEVVTIAA